MKKATHNTETEINPVDIYVGQKLRDFREKVGWTLSDLADKVGVSHQQIHKYEQGLTKISASMLYKLTTIFKTTSNCFFDGFNPEAFQTKEIKIDDLISLETKGHINLLLIEDNPADEFLVRKVLESAKYQFEIYCLHEGDEVLDFLRHKISLTSFSRPDIILLDLNLPKVNGLSILRALKQDRDLQGIPVLVLTSSLSKMDMVNAYKNYASGYIIKSFEFEVFKKNLLMALNYWVETVVFPEQA